MNQISISQINLNGQVTQDELFDANGKIKQELIPTGTSFTPYKCTGASDTPKGVKWTKDGVEITGTLEPSASTMSSIYFVPNTTGSYKQYVTFRKGSEGSYTYFWECINNDSFDPSELIARVNKLDASVNAIILHDASIDSHLVIIDSSISALDSSVAKLDASVAAIVLDSSVYIKDIADSSNLYARRKNEWVKIDDIGGDKYYRHQQTVDSSIWTIEHNLNKYPNVTIISSDNKLTFGDIEYVSTNKITVMFTKPLSGEAYVN